MQIPLLRTLFKQLVLITTVLCAVGLVAQDVKTRNGVQIEYGREIHRELTVPADTKTAVKDFFPSFLEYQDLVMFHPKFGYYSSGRVSFTNDYQTFPIVLAPYFGQMIAEQMYFMWQGMRKAGTLAPNEKFTMAEFGAGDGAMAESILDYIVEKSDSDPGWKEFANQALYICYDRSPALNNTQRERNQRFGTRFAARVADATDLTATIPAGSLKGVILSNELPDAFSVHKVILSPNGTPEVAFVVPSIPAKNWSTIRPLLSTQVAKSVEDDDVKVEKKFFEGKSNPTVFLTKASFIALLENLLPTSSYETAANAIQFQEIYVPASVVPELAAHLKRNAAVYAGVLAKTSRGLVTYINLGAESLVRGGAAVLKSGYMLTIDYGSTWDGILGEDAFSHFRAYGPAHHGSVSSDDDSQSSDNQIYNPYLGPTLNDMTTDVNFSLLAAEGQLVGLKPMFFGSQLALQSGTSISLEDAPSNAHEKYYSWVPDFQNPGVYKVFLQQKDGSDSAYSYPDKAPESLGLDRSTLTDAQRVREMEIEKRLSGALPPAPLKR